AAAGELLRQRPARRDVGRLARRLRRLLRHDRRAGLCLGQRRRKLERKRSRFPPPPFGPGPDTLMILLPFPAHLRAFTQAGREVEIEVSGPVTQRTVLDALETRYPVLRGAIRDYGTQQRRPLVRFFACKQDLSHETPDTPLPDEVAIGREPFLIVGAIAGG